MAKSERTEAMVVSVTWKATQLALALAVALGTSLGCERDAVDVQVPRDGLVSVKDGALRGKVTSVRSATGGIDGLSAVGGEGGPRSLAPGDEVGSGETIRADAGLEAVIAFSDDTAMVMREGARVALEGEGAEAGLTVEAGEVSVSRPVNAASDLALTAAGAKFGVRSGRATIGVEGTGEGRLLVEAGEVEIPKTGQRLRAGQTVRIAGDGGLTLERAARIGPAYSSAEILPLVPDVLGAPPPKDLFRGIGTLTARIPGSGRTNEQALRLTKHDVRATIRDGVAMTRIEEAFSNDSGRTVEATYKFMIPSGASITRLALEVNGRIEEGEVLDKNRARRIFKQIVDDSVRPRDPALLEWERGSSFSMKIFPIAPGETRRVFISYLEPMTAEGGRVRYVYPMGGPAGSPDISEFSIGLDIESPYGIASMRTPLYPARVDASGNRAEVVFTATDYAPSADFVLEYAEREEPAQVRTITETEKNGQAYALAIVRPKIESAPSIGDTRIVLAVDTSYGISEELRALAASTVLELIAGLGPSDSFAVLACDSGCRQLSRGFQRPGRESLVRAREFLLGVEPGGASDLLGAMEHAFAMARDGVTTSVVYIGDGVPTAGELDPGELLRTLKRTRPANVTVQAIGIGPDVDSVLMDAMAASLGGSSYRLSIGESPAVAAWNVARRMWAPGLRDVDIQWPPGVVDGYPTRVGFLPKGTELLLTAALAGTASAPGQVTIRATAPDGSPWEKTFPLSAPTGESAAGFVSRLWAKAHLDSLELAGGRDAEILEVSRRMRVASRLTSWIVLENEKMYERFKVQRTDAEEWDGTVTALSEVAEDESGAIAGEDLDALAFGDSASADEKSPSGSGALGGLQSGYGTGAGGGGRPEAMSSAARGAASPTSADAQGEAREKEESSKKAKIAADRPSPAMESPAKAAEPVYDSVGTGSEGSLGDLGYIATTGPTSSGKSKRPNYGCGYQTEYSTTIGGPPTYGPAAASKAIQLQSMVDQRPLSREAHRRYVRYLARLGDTGRATAAADAWRAADPMGTDALTAYADQIARAGDRARAVRIYASLAELSPRSWKTHLRLAEAFRDMGWYGAAAGHYRAASGTGAKSTNESMLDYLLCLAASGQRVLLDIEADKVSRDRAYRSIHGKVAELVAGSRGGLLPAWPSVEPGGVLKLRLEVDRPGVDLDLAVIDPAGRRVSGLWRRGASVKDMSLAQEETLSLGSLSNGTYHILVTRTDSAQVGPVTGRVSVKARDKHRTLPFTITGAEVVVGLVKHSKTEHYRCGY